MKSSHALFIGGCILAASHGPIAILVGVLFILLAISTDK